ncbi:MAG TPA: hypothetical protein VK674_03980 [Candidatus Limnocylindria bacterium]|nr:hypothetical protein [Candidatus Limnocylindria bacterium]
MESEPPAWSEPELFLSVTGPDDEAHDNEVHVIARQVMSRPAGAITRFTLLGESKPTKSLITTSEKEVLGLQALYNQDVQNGE